MQNFNYQAKSYKTTSSTLYDEGLRQYFLKIYALMSTGLAITAIAVLSVPLLTNMMFNIALGGYLVGMTSIGWLITFAPLGISLYFAFRLDIISTQNAQMLFWVYATLISMSLAFLGFVYTGASITKTFLICSAMFGGMSLYRYSIKKDLTSMGSFLFMGLIGLVIASLINILFRSPAIEFALSFLGVLIFTGLIATIRRSCHYIIKMRILKI